MIQASKFETYIEFADNEGELYGPFEEEKQVNEFVRMTEQFRGHQVEWWWRFRKAEE